MSRVKGGPDLPRPPPQGRQAGRRLLRRPLDQLPHRQAGGRQGAAIRHPRPQGPQAQLPRPLDPAHQRRRARARRRASPTPASSTASTKAGIEVDRKVLADLAVHEPAAFGAIVDQAKSALA